MLSRFGRWRHLVVLVPLGVAVGAVAGFGFDDLLFGLAAGAAFGVVFGLLFAWRAPHD